MTRQLAVASPSRPQAQNERSGVIIVLTAVLLVFLLGVIAFAVDLGFIANTRTELQTAADAAAYAGAGALVNGSAAAVAEAQNFYVMNKVAGAALPVNTSSIEVGLWNDVTRSFGPTNGQPNAVRVTSGVTNKPLFFANVFNIPSFNMNASAVATYLPRDVVLVLDYSRSMCFDSTFDNANLLGQAYIQSNIQKIWQDLGSPNYGTSLTFTPVYRSTNNVTNIKNFFNMKNNNYPYPGGSWDDYIDYVKTDSTLNSVGYRKYYGMMTLINYWQTYEARAVDTPGFHNTRQQPLTAVKDAVDVFLSYLQSHSTDDRVGLSLYSSSNNTALLESPLTKTYSTVSNIVRARQAGHYTGGTNISAGMNRGRLELQNNARVGAKKMMILMTDGEATLPSGNTNSDKAAVITEANAAAAAKIPIITITVGADADTALMQQVASITGGVYFQVPGGQQVAAVQAQLEAVFAQVAADRPLKLVQ